jgi:hypothetical protein
VVPCQESDGNFLFPDTAGDEENLGLPGLGNACFALKAFPGVSYQIFRSIRDEKTEMNRPRVGVFDRAAAHNGICVQPARAEARINEYMHDSRRGHQMF